MQHTITDDLKALLATLPPEIQDAVNQLENRSELLEIVMDLGRLPEGRFPEGEVILSSSPISYADLEYVVERIGEFGDDNRAGIERTLHRISALRNRKGRIVGLTCRIGRAVLGSIALIRDIVEQGKSILILGRPGVGKTTLLREIARVLADEADKRVVVVDTSNEIAGDGDIPHPGIGKARRMQVARTAEQHAVMIEAVENHMPQVIVIDEIGTELEAAAARTIAERGVQLVATAHGNSLSNLLMNPTLSDLVGGIQTVTLGDEEARRRHTQKSILERKAPPTFEVVVEQQSWEIVTVHSNVAGTVDNLLRGVPIVAEERTRDETSGQLSSRRIAVGGMDLPSWGTGSLGRQPPNRRGPGNLHEVNPTNARNGHFSNVKTQSALQEYSSAKNGSSEGGTIAESQSTPVAEGIYQAAQLVTEMPTLKALRLYPFGINRDRLAAVVQQLNVPVTMTNNEREADAFITLKNYYRRQPEQLQQAEQARKLIVILKNNSIEQMQHALARIFDIPEPPVSSNESEFEDEDGDHSFDYPTKLALEEAKEAILRLLNEGLSTAELSPANAYVRRLQHQMANDYDLLSRSRGKEPHRRVKIFRAHA